MLIQCLGLNHRTAPLDLLEQLHLSQDQVQAALSRAGCGRDASRDGLLELALLSTCNRVEAYAVSTQAGTEPLRTLLAESAGLDSEALDEHLYQYQGPAAVEHLLEVAAGLDSMVLGEPQILGQVADAHTMALRADSSGPVLARVFRTAIHGGKRARSETDIATNPATTSSVAVSFASDIVKSLGEAHVTVIGAGEMAELAVRSLRKREVTKITVVNRTLDKARELASRWDAEARTFEHLSATLQSSDIVIASTGAPHPILYSDMLENVMNGRATRPLVVLDIAVPRDVESEVADIPGVHLYDLEALNRHLEGSMSIRERQVPAVKAIIREEMADFERWYESLRVRPLIAALHQRADAIRREEIERTLRQMGDLDEAQLEHLDALTRAVVKKLLHAPTLRLKEQSRNGNAAAYALVARDLFDLDPPETDLDQALEALK